MIGKGNFVAPEAPCFEHIVVEDEVDAEGWKEFTSIRASHSCPTLYKGIFSSAGEGVVCKGGGWIIEIAANNYRKG